MTKINLTGINSRKGFSMKYQANPVIVDAFKIEGIADNLEYDCLNLRLDSGEVVRSERGMTARYFPKLGDYWVIQDDGYKYLNPKDVFERKYSALNNNV